MGVGSIDRDIRRTAFDQADLQQKAELYMPEEQERQSKWIGEEASGMSWKDLEGSVF